MSSKGLTCDRALVNALRKLGDKQSKMNYVATTLGSSRVVRLFRDPDPTAPFPSVTGTEVANLSVNGNMTLVGGAITGLGTIYQVNKFDSNIDLSTGAAVLRVEGNGHYVQGTAGLVSGFDFNFLVNPDPTKGFGFDASSSLNAPVYDPSGTGPTAPIKTLDAPHTLELYDCSDPANEKLAGTTSFTVQLVDYVLEDVDMARNHGDSAMYQTTDILWGNFSFGATLLISNPQNTEVGNIPYYSVAGFWKREGSWVTYPQNNTFLRQYMVANPPPHRVVLKDGHGNVLYTWQMHGGQPINDFRLNSGNYHRGGRDANNPLQPQFDSGMALFWENTNPRMTDFIKKIYPGLRNFRPTMGKSYLTIIGIEPLFTGGYDSDTANGLSNFWYAPQWPGVDGPQTVTDPDLSLYVNGNSSAAYWVWAEGYGYEPGAFGTHNWYTSPGGPRNDRSVINSILACFLNDPTGSRVQGSVPWRTYISEYNKNSFNHSNHWVTSASGMTTVPIEEILEDDWTIDGTYYGNYHRNKALQMNGDQRGGTNATHYDVDGNMFWSGWARDPLHNYHNRGWAALTFCGPMHALTSKFDTLNSIMLNNNPFDGGYLRANYLVRTMAWEWLQLVLAWKCGSKHPCAISQQTIEDYFAKILEALYKYHYKPIFIDNEDTPYGRGMRQLGLALDYNSSGGFTEGGGRLGFYMGHTLQLMKQTGFWYKMIARGALYETVLKNLLRNMDTFCFGNIVDAGGRGLVYFTFGNGSNSDLNTIPTSWAAWYNNSVKGTDDDYTDYIHDFVYDNNGIVRNGDGSPQVQITPNKDVAFNTFEQYARLRADYFPEIPHPQMQAAIDAFDNWETQVTNFVAATQNEKWRVDYKYRYPGVAPFLGPQQPGDLVTG